MVPSILRTSRWRSFTRPGLKIVYPSTPRDAKGLLKSAIRDDDPVLFEEHKGLYRAPQLREVLPDEEYVIPLGEARVAREGTDLTVVTYGMMVHRSLEAAAVLHGEGIDVEVLDLRTLLPLDEDRIVESVEKTGKLLIVHEDTRTGGIAGEIAMRVNERAFEWLDGPDSAGHVDRLARPLQRVPRGLLPARRGGYRYSRTLSWQILSEADRVPARPLLGLTPTQSPERAENKRVSRIEVPMPQMGESIAEGTVSKWLKQPGDAVERDEPILEISTDKVDAEIPSPAAGVLVEVKVGEGETVEVGTIVAFIDTEAAPGTAEAPLTLRLRPPLKRPLRRLPHQLPRLPPPPVAAPASAGEATAEEPPSHQVHAGCSEDRRGSGCEHRRRPRNGSHGAGHEAGYPGLHREWSSGACGTGSRRSGPGSRAHSGSLSTCRSSGGGSLGPVLRRGPSPRVPGA